MTEPLERFSGKIFRRGDGAYGTHRYQYAFSSYAAEGRMEPAAILYPRSTDDVLLAIEHARRHSLSLAVRTGGHQMSGTSSTSGPNVLLDLRETFPAFEWDPRQGTARVGVSHSLRTFNAMLGERGLFVPHGQCSHVRLGGHVQTGGYGMLARSFGLLSDYVEAIEIVTADGKPRLVRRDGRDEEERDLFFATLGGSPGSFGVLTHVHLRPLHDQDHPNARGLKFLVPYSRRRLQALLDLAVEMASDDDFPRDVDFVVSALGGAQVNLPFAISRGVDQQMRVLHPEVYGRSEHAALPASIAVYAQWANTGGPGQRFDPTLFRRIKAAAGYGSARSPDASGFHRLRDSLRFRALVEAVENRARLGSVRVGRGFEAPVPLSELTHDWLFQNVREFDLPYVKRS